MTFLTVCVNEPTRSHVKQWMGQRGWDFTVLWNDGYNRKAGVRAFPTTLFLDREGRVAFRVVGGGERIIQEFGWRVDALGGEG